MSEYTTIQVTKSTKEHLHNFREYNRETYDEILNKLMKVVEIVRREGELSEETLASIERGKKDIKEGRIYSTKEVLAMIEK